MKPVTTFAAFAIVLACGPEAKAPPVVAVPVPDGHVRFIAGGDSRDDAAHVLPWAFREAKARGASAFLFLGDMELTPQFDAHFRAELDNLGGVPFYPALGNHEVKLLGALGIGENGAKKKFRENFLGTKYTPIRSLLDDKVVYSANLPGHVHFIALDNVSQAGFGKDQLEWLEKDLDDARGNPEVRHIFVGMHKPLAHNGVSSHGMDEDGAQGEADSDAALAMFQHARVELILSSHVHQFIRVNQGGIRGYITGGLGAPLNHAGPEHAFHHFLVIDVAGDRVDVDVVRFDGKQSMEADNVSGSDPGD